MTAVVAPFGGDKTLRHWLSLRIQPMRIPFAAATLILFAITLQSSAQEQTQKPSVSTTGDAVVYVRPDEAVVSFGVETYDASLERAKQQNDEKSGTLVKAVIAMGIEEKHVATDRVEVELRYADRGKPIAGIEGYYARRSYSVTLKDVKQLEKLIDTVLKSGANRLSGIEFRTTELRKHRDQARKMAIKAAKEKAELLASELGVGVGGPRTISESGSYGYWGGRSFNGNAFMQNSAQVVPGGDGGGESTPLGQISVTASVSVTFDLK